MHLWDDLGKGTTNAKQKNMNELMEALFRSLEILASCKSRLCVTAYHKEFWEAERLYHKVHFTHNKHEYICSKMHKHLKMKTEKSLVLQNKTWQKLISKNQ